MVRLSHASHEYPDYPPPSHEPRYTYIGQRAPHSQYPGYGRYAPASGGHPRRTSPMWPVPWRSEHEQGEFRKLVGVLSTLVVAEALVLLLGNVLAVYLYAGPDRAPGLLNSSWTMLVVLVEAGIPLLLTVVSLAVLWMRLQRKHAETHVSQRGHDANATTPSDWDD